ncbi:hypothetical protein K1719_033578 [Acacia pycnantha]|nr:hypothetical protein K1719_033578 [Acacia pycnantha]
MPRKKKPGDKPKDKQPSMRRKKINELLSRCSKPISSPRIAGDYQTFAPTKKLLHQRDQPVRQFPKYRDPAINKQEYDLANAKFALELAQKRPPQVTTPLLVTPANNPMDTPYIAKLEQVKPVLQLEPEFFFGTPNEITKWEMKLPVIFLYLLTLKSTSLFLQKLQSYYINLGILPTRLV